MPDAKTSHSKFGFLSQPCLNPELCPQLVATKCPAKSARLTTRLALSPARQPSALLALQLFFQVSKDFLSVVCERADEVFWLAFAALHSLLLLCQTVLAFTVGVITVAADSYQRQCCTSCTH